MISFHSTAKWWNKFLQLLCRLRWRQNFKMPQGINDAKNGNFELSDWYCSTPHNVILHRIGDQRSWLKSLANSLRCLLVCTLVAQKIPEINIYPLWLRRIRNWNLKVCKWSSIRITFFDKTLEYLYCLLLGRNGARWFKFQSLLRVYFKIASL